jgi:plasmid stabilization system protein ParE
MPADKSKAKYTNKQKRKASHIKSGYKKSGVSEDEAERRAWATVNKQDGGGKKSGSGRAKTVKAKKATTRKKTTKAKSSTTSKARNGRRTRSKK